MNEEFPFPPYLFAIVFPILFPALWFLILFILSKVSGWTSLAERYAHTGILTGKRYHFQTARINRVNFGSCLTLSLEDQGLYLTPQFIFRPFHKPILIPWTDLRAEKFKRFFLTGYRLTSTHIPSVTIQISDRQFGRLAPRLTHTLPL